MVSSAAGERICAVFVRYGKLLVKGLHVRRDVKIRNMQRDKLQSMHVKGLQYLKISVLLLPDMLQVLCWHLRRRLL